MNLQKKNTSSHTPWHSDISHMSVLVNKKISKGMVTKMAGKFWWTKALLGGGADACFCKLRSYCFAQCVVNCDTCFNICVSSKHVMQNITQNLLSLTGAGPNMAASASMPPTPQPRMPRPLIIVLWESVPTRESWAGFPPRTTITQQIALLISLIFHS